MAGAAVKACRLLVRCAVVSNAFVICLNLHAYTKFQYQLSGTLKNWKVDWVFLDLFDTPKSKITEFKAQGKKVICYFSAGTFENWRSDKSKFPSKVRGNDLEDWEGEQWLDVRSTAVLNIMRSRMDLAKSKGCHGVDLDNVDGFDNDTGFDLSKNNSVSYLKSLAREAKARGLMAGLKNSAEIAPSLASTLDFAVVEECMKYNECSSYSNFVKMNKKSFSHRV